MGRLKVEVGTKIERAQSCHVVIDIDVNDNVVLEEIHTRRRHLMLRNCLEKELLVGVSIMSGDDGLEQEAPKCPIDMLPPELKEVVSRRQAYVQVLDAEAIDCSVRSIVERVRRTVSHKINDQDPPSNASLFRWLRAWRLSGGSPSSLIPEFKNRGRSRLEIYGETQDLIEEGIKKHYWKPERPTLQAAYIKIGDLFDLRNKDRSLEDQLVLPSLSSVHRIEKRMNAYNRILKRRGKAAADRRFRAIMNTLEVEAPLDLVQIDHTVLDIHVIAPVKGLVARPRLTVALDTYSRMPVGIYVGFISPGYESVMLCLKQSIEAKDGLLADFGAINNDWPCYGLPRRILVDNGMEFHSESLRDACNQLGIGIVNHPVREPRYKGAVERFFRTINQGFLSQLKGKTFSNIMEKGDYDSVAKAVIPFDVFQEMLYKWIVDVYMQRFHRGIEAVPVEEWNKGVKNFPVDVPSRAEDLLTLLCEKKRRTLTSQGIEIHSAHYNSDELAAFLLRNGKPKKPSLKVSVKRNPADLGSIYVFDPKQEKYIEAYCYDAPLKGVSLWQLKLARRRVAQRKKAASDRYDVETELKAIWHIIDQSCSSKRNRSNLQAARYMEYEANRANGKHDAAESQVPEIPEGAAEAEAEDQFRTYMEDAVSKGWVDLDGDEGNDDE